MKKILIADLFHEEIIQNYKNYLPIQDLEISYLPYLKPKDIGNELQNGYNSLILKSKEVSEECLEKWREKFPQSRLCVARAGSDPSHIAFDKAFELNIPIMNIPGANCEFVSDYIINNIPLKGNSRIISFIGFGAIAELTAEKLLDRNFILRAYSPNILSHKKNLKISFCSELDEAIFGADFVIILTPLITKERATNLNNLLGRNLLKISHNIVNKNILNKLNRNASIINPSRPWIIDITDLENSIITGRVDNVFINTSSADIEKLRKEHPFFSFNMQDNVRISQSTNFLNLNTEKGSKIHKDICLRSIENCITYLEVGVVNSPIFNINFN